MDVSLTATGPIDELVPNHAEAVIPDQELDTTQGMSAHTPPPANDESPSIDPTLTFCVRAADGNLQTIDALPLPESERVGFDIGVKLDDRYQLQRELGRGGMGRVFLAWDERLRRPVAVKVMLRPACLADRSECQQHEQMFAAEARLGAGLVHPAIANVFDYGFHQGMPYTIFELLTGRTLRELIRERAPLPMDDVRLIIGPLAQALHYAHQRRVVHRDLKPENIRATEQDHFKILDLGLAKRFDRGEGDWRIEPREHHASPLIGR